MNDRWQQWQQKIDGLNQRERILVMLTCLVLVIMVMQLLFIDPLLASREKLKNSIKQSTSQSQLYRNEQQLISAQLEAGVNRSKELQQQRLQQRLDQLNKEIENSIVAMIPPRLMPQVLEQVLIKDGGLTLLSIENKVVTPVIVETVDEQQDGEDGKTESPQQGLYQHGFILRLRGNYSSAMKYFEDLAALPWNFHWDVLRYQVDQYPDAEITLEVHTVSMSEEWIGV